jgi:prolyl 4-hydroxylase
MSTVDKVREIEKWTHEGKWTAQMSFQRDTWLINRSFGRDYLVQTKRNWLANFPQPYYSLSRVDGVDGREEGVLTNVDTTTSVEDGLHMWQAEYIDQIHTFVTSNLYYTSLPEKLARLTKDDYDPLIDEQRRLNMRTHQSNSLKKKDGAVDNSNGNVDTTMQLTLRVLSVAPRVLEAKRFLSPIEAQHLIDLASGTKGDVVMKRSTVSASSVKGSNYNRGKGSRADIRTSNSGWIHREQDVIVDTIFRRIADLLNINESLMRDLDYNNKDDVNDDNNTWLPTHDRIVEAMQLVRYEAGEEYTAHHDFTYPSMKNRHQPRRYVTVLLYLTGEGDVIDENGIRRSAASISKTNDKVVVDGLQGGETVFPRAITTSNHDGIKVKPRSGNAIVFYNVLPDGNLDDLSQHAGGKVERGVKYVANIWVWDPIVN